MRFHQSMGVVQQNINLVNGINGNNPESRFLISNKSNKQLTQLNTRTSANINLSVESENGNNFSGDNDAINNCATINNFNHSQAPETNNLQTFENILKFRDSKYFCNYFNTQQTTNNNFDVENGNNDNILIEALNLNEENLSKFVTPTTYDNCITNQSYNERNCLSAIQRQRRENLIKLDLQSNYMTKYEAPMQIPEDNSAGSSVESSPVDSLLDDQDLVSPTLSSCADLSSPATHDLQQRQYPRGIINPNYPGFQHLAHTLAEHFIDHHHFEHSSDSEISDDFDFDVAYRCENFDNVTAMSDINDSNNNNDNINNNANDLLDKNIDLNRNKNRRCIEDYQPQSVNDFAMKEYDSNLLMKSEPKVFCESKQLGLNEEFLEMTRNQHEFERFSSDDDDEECANVTQSKHFKLETDLHRMDYEDDELADLSGDDDLAIKNELEGIDKAENDFNENINCDLATYLQSYDFKMDLQKSYHYDSECFENEMGEECLTDEDNSKLPTPDILIKHNNNKKLQNAEMRDGMEATDKKEHTTIENICGTDVSSSDDVRDYQPDLIKSITDAINTNDNNHENRAGGKPPTAHDGSEINENGEGDNEISSTVEHEILSNTRITNDNDEKIINQETDKEVPSVHAGSKMEINFHPLQGTSRALSLESATSHVDIIGDFGKEVEKEIGLIAFGYRNATNGMCTNEVSPKEYQMSVHSGGRQQTKNRDELVLDENKFIEHLKYFSKMGDAVLSNIEEKIIGKSPLVEKCDHHESNSVNVSQIQLFEGLESLIPTAIVKPKYQKLAFDERQLPICGSTDDALWHSPTNTSSLTTITTTPRKVQKHLPNFDRRAQKSLSKASTARKLVNSDVSDKETINSLRYSEKDIDCSVIQNSIAIVQPLKKVIVETGASAKRFDEKNQKLIDASKNSASMSHKYEPKSRNNSKASATNEITSRMSDCGNNNLNIDSQKVVKSGGGEKCNNVTNISERKLTSKDQKKDNSDIFDVYNIETALPVIDLAAIESHLMAAKEEEQKRKNDREAIRRRLAMGEEDDYFSNLAASRPIRKPNLQSRLQSGKNLQICFMNEAASDSESSDSETCPKLSQGMDRRRPRPSSLMAHRSAHLNKNPYNSRPLSIAKSVMDKKAERPVSLPLGLVSDASDNNFFTHQARLQIEARMALSQAKDMAHMQMEIERQKQGMSPITELVHKTLDKVGMQVAPSKRRLSRQMLTNMNIAQLQIIINEFHTYIETLNEQLVKYLMDRDDLSMKQDSMLIDVEDITRYLAEKEEAQLNNGNNVTSKQQPSQQLQQKPIVSKSAFIKHSVTPNRSAVATAITSLSIAANKKSLVVNGNGSSPVITSISREKFQPNKNRLHL